MARMSRRSFLLSSAALSAGCAMRRPGTGAMASSVPNIRPPAVGQSWHYAKRDLYTHSVIDNQLDRVGAIGRTIEIDSSSDVSKDDNAVKGSWGSNLLRKYISRHDTPTGALPSEIQQPWGMVLVDAHWAQVQVYETPIPLWPAQLQPGWQTHIRTKYKTPTSDDALSWEQTMKAHDWESVSVPAGQFKALRYSNSIKFKNGDVARADSVRQETLWFAPEIGRWVARESTGSYYADDSAVDQPYNENGYRWELLEWA